LLALVFALGGLALAPVLLGLWDVWVNVPLRSIGMLIVPAAVILALRVWRQRAWELNGTWWGLLPIALALVWSDLHSKFALALVDGTLKFDLFAPKLSLYFFASGLVLLFAGVRVWRQAWFPLLLLLCAQAVPNVADHYLDITLQNQSAHIARWFAGLIGFPPTTPELLRLMFTPDFGMFIAPGCDGLRGAVTLGYVALIAGYLKRVSILRWVSYVVGAVLLGYLFNLIRLCALVLYYRLAAGHAWFEHVAKQADYVIGGCLFLVAAILFLWVVFRNDDNSTAVTEAQRPPLPGRPARSDYWKLAAAAALVLLFVVPGVQAIGSHGESFSQSVRNGDLSPSQLDAMMPTEIGVYRLNRAWQEESDGRVELESAVYAAPGADEIIVGVWLPPGWHTMHESWRARGQDPLEPGDRSFTMATGQPVEFDSAYYSDGITDSFAGNALCSPSSCLSSHRAPGLHFEFAKDPIDFSTRGSRAVPIFFRIDRPHDNTPEAALKEALSAEARQFLASADFTQISRKFQ